MSFYILTSYIYFNLFLQDPPEIVNPADNELLYAKTFIYFMLKIYIKFVLHYQKI